MEKKVIVIIRESTVRQEIESQTEEICNYVETFGYKKDEIIVIGKQGASAIKLDESYRKNLNLVYETINITPTIERVFAWSLDRIARNDAIAMQFKNFLIEKKVDLVIKNPALFLFNPDGTVNSGMEMAFSLFATMAKQEMELKGERFKRAKKYNASNGKFIGAKHLIYGYATNSDGYLVIDEEESKVVKLIFDLYCTQKYSSLDLANELNERALKNRKVKFTDRKVSQILRTTAYIGYEERNKLFTKYPVIISEEQFKEVESIRMSKNKLLDRSQTHINLASKILKCFYCGYNYTKNYSTDSPKYGCYKRKHKARFKPEEYCTESTFINADTIDGLLKDLAYELRSFYNEDQSEIIKEELQKKKDLLLKKIDNLSEDIPLVNLRLERLVDAWSDNVISEKAYNDRRAKAMAERENINSRISNIRNEIREIDRLLTKKDNYVEQLEETSKEINEYKSDNKKLHKEVIDKFIKVAYVISFKINGTNLTGIFIIDYLGELHSYVYFQHHFTKESLYYIEGSKLVKYHKDYIVTNNEGKIIREKKSPETAESIQVIMDSSKLTKELITKMNELGKAVLAK